MYKNLYYKVKKNYLGGAESLSTPSDTSEIERKHKAFVEYAESTFDKQVFNVKQTGQLATLQPMIYEKFAYLQNAISKYGTILNTNEPNKISEFLIKTFENSIFVQQVGDHYYLRFLHEKFPVNAYIDKLNNVMYDNKVKKLYLDAQSKSGLTTAVHFVSMEDPPKSMDTDLIQIRFNTDAEKNITSVHSIKSHVESTEKELLGYTADRYLGQRIPTTWGGMPITHTDLNNIKVMVRFVINPEIQKQNIDMAMKFFY